MKIATEGKTRACCATLGALIPRPPNFLMGIRRINHNRNVERHYPNIVSHIIIPRRLNTLASQGSRPVAGRRRILAWANIGRDDRHDVTTLAKSGWT